MTKPTFPETAAFLNKLRMQASFMGDPAIIGALSFIERLLAVDEPGQNNAAPAAEPTTAIKKAA
jgi:hypothetical protein